MTSGARATQYSGALASKRLADAEEECADLLTWPAVEFKSVIEAQDDERVAHPETEARSRAEVAKSELIDLAEYVANINEADRIEYPEEGVADLVVEDKHGIAAYRYSVRELGPQGILLESTDGGAAAGVKAVGEHEVLRVEALLQANARPGRKHQAGAIGRIPVGDGSRRG